MKKLIVILLVFTAAAALAGCGAKSTDAKKDLSSLSDADIEKQIEEKISEINNTLEGNAELWNKLTEKTGTAPNIVFEGNNYSNYLSESLEKNKSMFSDEEQNKMKQDIEKIKAIEGEITALNEELGKRGGKTSSSQTFPSFKGQDLNGKPVDSSMFSENKATVVNFWFSTCPACIEELGKLNELNKSLQEKGGAVIGVNTDTFDGQEAKISEAKDILKKKGAEYRNIWVTSDSELAKLTQGFTGYPITYVLDKNGTPVGEPVLGGIDNPTVMEMLQKQIDSALQSAK